jgi:plasmid stabilization system protein ParE
MTYAVRISPAAEAAILAQARYIAIDQQAPLNAVRWLQSMFDAADGLDEYPRRYPLAAENDRRSYEIR